jgi:hypothetical protein
VLVILGLVGGMIWRKAVSKVAKAALASRLASAKLKIAWYLVAMTLNIYDTVMDVRVYRDMILGVEESKKGAERLCTAWNNNIDLSLASLTGAGRTHGENDEDGWIYRDVAAFFKDTALLKIGGESTFIKNSTNFIAMVKCLNVFPNNTEVAKTFISEHENTCLNSNEGNYCYFDSTTYECKAYDHNKYDTFGTFIYLSFAVVALKEGLKLLVVLYLLSCSSKSEGIPLSLRAAAMSSLLRPFLLLVLPAKVFRIN